jgi:hypothetical protein
MNPSKSLSWKSVIAILTIAAAFPALAQKRRAVMHPSPPGASLTIIAKGTVTDAVTGAPVAFAEVRLGDRSDKTDRKGVFSLRATTVFGSGTLTAARSGYVTSSESVTTGGTLNLTIRLQPTATTTLRLPNGTTHQVDTESIEFGYVPPFGSYNKSSTEDFCRADGSAVRIEVTQIARVTGPATLETHSPCCGSGPLLKINAQLKTGESLPLYFTDSCQGYTVDFIGRDHVTGDFVFAKFTELNEIIFP